MKTLNEYGFDVTSDVPPEPDRLYTPSQLESALEEAYNISEAEVSKRFKKRVAEVTQMRIDDPITGRVSWKVFDEEEHTVRASGWEVICSALEDTSVIEREK